MTLINEWWEPVYLCRTEDEFIEACHKFSHDSKKMAMIRYIPQAEEPKIGHGYYKPKITIETEPKKPEGIIPRITHLFARAKEITLALNRYREAGLDIPKEWTKELADIIEEIRHHKF